MISPLYTVNRCDLVACQSCGFVQVAQQPAASDLEAIYQATYFSHSKYADNQTQRLENHRRLTLMRRFLPANGAQVLDAGCGTGDFLEQAKTRYRMSGFDISPFATQMASERNPELAERIWAGDFSRLREEPQPYDAICLWDVIEHLWNPVEVATTLLDKLVGGGFLFLSTPNIGALTARVLRQWWPFMTPPEHLSFFTRQTFYRLFEDQLDCQIVDWESKGKKVNVGFMLYKVRRKAPLLMPEWLTGLFRRPPLARLSVYVPTGDIQYLVVRKQAS